VPFDREKVKQETAKLAANGVFVGKSSWKYEGWFGQLYTPSRYEYRGKVAKTRFERDCLSEYPPIASGQCGAVGLQGWAQIWPSSAQR